jgi:hypothetical protein
MRARRQRQPDIHNARDKAFDASDRRCVDLRDFRGAIIARTALFVPEEDRLYVASRARGGEPASLMIFQPAP